ncbi:hypothetical protein GCM10022382_18880 [Microbacterium invictum]
MNAAADTVVVEQLERAVAEINGEAGELAGAGGDMDVVVGLAPEQGNRTNGGEWSEGDDGSILGWTPETAPGPRQRLHSERPCRSGCAERSSAFMSQT